MPIKTYRIPDELEQGLERTAAKRGVSRTLLVREALTQYLASSATEEPTLVELIDRVAPPRGSGVGDLAARSEHYLRKKLGGRRRPR
jgi:hypothetical protein